MKHQFNVFVFHPKDVQSLTAIFLLGRKQTLTIIHSFISRLLSLRFHWMFLILINGDGILRSQRLKNTSIKKEREAITLFYENHFETSRRKRYDEMKTDKHSGKKPKRLFSKFATNSHNFKQSFLHLRIRVKFTQFNNIVNSLNGVNQIVSFVKKTFFFPKCSYFPSIGDRIQGR